MDPISGLYTLEEMRLLVRRRLDTYRPIVDPLTGIEAGVQQLDPLVTNDDINMYLNSALTMRMIDLTTADATIMSDESAIDIVALQVEYPLPEDLQFLRSVYYKWQSVAYTIAPPNQRLYLYEYDQEGDINENLFDWATPTYRRRLNSIVLNQIPQLDNPGGLVVEYVKLMLPLSADDQVLESPLARILQEVIVLDATILILTERIKIPATELRMSLKTYVDRLTLAGRNYSDPKVIRMASPVRLTWPYGSRTRGWRNWR